MSPSTDAEGREVTTEPADTGQLQIIVGRARAIGHAVQDRSADLLEQARDAVARSMALARERIEAMQGARAPALRRPVQHVVPHGDDWAVRREGAARVTAVFATKNEALDRARAIAENQRGELVVHRADGSIQEHRSYRER